MKSQPRAFALMGLVSARESVRCSLATGRGLGSMLAICCGGTRRRLSLEPASQPGFLFLRAAGGACARLWGAPTDRISAHTCWLGAGKPTSERTDRRQTLARRSLVTGRQHVPLPPRRSGLLRLSAAYFYLDFPHRFGRSARERPGPPNGTDMWHRSRSLSFRRMCRNTTLTYIVRLDFRRAWPLDPWVSQEDGLQSARLLIPPDRRLCNVQLSEPVFPPENTPSRAGNTTPADPCLSSSSQCRP